MDGLDLLKKDWKKSENNFKQVSDREIYKMIHKSSSSIVKWIFIISLLEFALWTGLSIFMKDSREIIQFNNYHVEYIMWPLMGLGYVILIYFFYQFFSNYRTISVTDNAKTLINRILKTRKVVHQYIWFNVLYGIVTSIIVTIIQVNKDEKIIAMLQQFDKIANNQIVTIAYILVCLLIIVVFFGLLYLLYRLVYGSMLKRLFKNYEELKKMEV